MSRTEHDPTAADLGNWRSLPYSRWAFHNIGALMPTALVARDTRQSWDLPAAPRNMDAFQIKLPNGEALDLATFHHLTATDAMVVLREGEIVYDYYANGNADHRPHILMSASKSVVGLIVAMLAEQGHLNADALVSHYMPEIGDTLYRNATLRDLLDMRVAIEFNAAQQRAYDIATNWEKVLDDEPALSLAAFFAGLEGPAAQRGPFKYISPNTDLLGLVVERATGERLATLISDLLWKPIGAQDDASITVDRAGAPRATGGLCATARDFARLGQLILQNGRRGDAAILPARWLTDIAENGDQEAWRNGEWAETFGRLYPHMHYRDCWYVVDDAANLIFAMGIYGQNLFVDLDNKMVVAKFSSQAERTDPQAIGLTHWALPALRLVLFDRTG